MLPLGFYSIERNIVMFINFEYLLFSQTSCTSIGGIKYLNLIAYHDTGLNIDINVCKCSGAHACKK